MVYKALIVTLLALCSSATAQKTMNKQWSSLGVSVLGIHTDEVYSIKLYSHGEPTIKVALYVEGETNESVVLEARSVQDTLILKTAYSPYFRAHNDKLAAHKVLAIEMTVFVPEELIVDLDAKLASVETYGRFKELLVQLDLGYGKFHDFTGNARIMSRLGFIDVRAGKGVSGEAISTLGEVVNELPAGGAYLVRAESRHGNVSLRPSQ
jgi:hypothetical protein